MVGVDDQNRSCVLGQGVLRSECKETFEWFLDSYETAAGGRRPKVRGAAQRMQTRWGERPLWGHAVSDCVSLPGCVPSPHRCPRVKYLTPSKHRFFVWYLLVD